MDGDGGCYDMKSVVQSIDAILGGSEAQADFRGPKVDSCPAAVLHSYI